MQYQYLYRYSAVASHVRISGYFASAHYKFSAQTIRRALSLYVVADQSQCYTRTMAKSLRFLAALAASLAALQVIAAQFDYSQQPIPDPFQLGDRYPDREEVEVCRPIVDHIDRNSARFTNELVLNTNPSITFSNNDARLMTSRMQTRLDRLRQLYTRGFTVLKAWTQYPDPEVADIASLHYEG